MSGIREIVVVESFEHDIHMTMSAVGLVRFGDPTLKNNDEDALIDLIQNADAVCITSRGAFTRRVIESSPKLRIIAKCGGPATNVDMDAATRSGIAVTWTPGSNAVCVAEHAFALILGVLKRIPQTMFGLQNGKWHSNDHKAAELTGKTVGIVGLGQAGYQLARMLAPFCVRILCCDPFAPPERAGEIGAEMCALEDLLAQSDIVSLHCASSPETYHLIDEKRLGAMKRGAYLVNTARGALIDEQALLDALEAKKIAGAALDVFEVEPASVDNPLLRAPGVIVTPHMAGFADEALKREAREAAEEIMRVMRGEKPVHVANPGYIEFIKH